MTKIVGLDSAAYKCGLSYLDTEASELLQKACVVEPDDTITDDDLRNYQVWLRLKKFLKTVSPDVVAIEDNRIGYANSKGHQDYYTKRLIGLVDDYCKRKKITLIFVTRGKFYSGVLGKGRGKAPKSELQTFLKTNYQIFTENDDESDAVGIAFYALKAR